MLSRSRKAFTLLELIVVIVILGILAALAIPTFVAVIAKAKESTAVSSAESIGRDAYALAAFDGVTDVTADADGDGTGTNTYLQVAAVEAGRAASDVNGLAVDMGDYTVTLAFTGSSVEGTAVLDVTP